MKLNQLLESIYDLSFTQAMYDYIYAQLFSAKKQLNVSRYYDITGYFNNQDNPYDRKIKLHVRTSQKNSEQRCNAFLSDNGEEVIIELVLKNRFENISMVSMKRIMRHEVTHALDLLKMKYYKMGDKRQEKYNRIVDGKRIPTYRNDEMEINAFVNLIPSYSKEFPRSWNGITTYEKMLDVLSSAAQFSKPSKELVNDKGFRRKIIARLHRENLLPPNLKL